MSQSAPEQPRSLDLSLAEMREAAVNLDRAVFRYFLGLNDRRIDPRDEAGAQLWEAVHHATEHSRRLRSFLAQAVDAAHEIENR
jgi:hypothetical protein